jgi:hypothetical protein
MQNAIANGKESYNGIANGIGIANGNGNGKYFA